MARISLTRLRSSVTWPRYVCVFVCWFAGFGSTTRCRVCVLVWVGNLFCAIHHLHILFLGGLDVVVIVFVALA